MTRQISRDGIDGWRGSVRAVEEMEDTRKKRRRSTEEKAAIKVIILSAEEVHKGLSERVFGGIKSKSPSDARHVDSLDAVYGGAIARVWANAGLSLRSLTLREGSSEERPWLIE